jgi:DNA primase
MKTFLDTIMDISRRFIDDPKAQNYLRARGCSLKQAALLGVGYLPDTHKALCPTGNTEDEEKFTRWSYNGKRLRGKLLFPITNAMGILYGIQIRSPAHDVKDYNKFYISRSKVDASFFGTGPALRSIWETREIYLCEGIFDLFPLQRIFSNVLCTGTANISRTQMQFLLRFADHLVFAFDKDWDSDYERFVYKHRKDFSSIRKLPIPTKDVSDYWALVGTEDFETHMTRSLL